MSKRKQKTERFYSTVEASRALGLTRWTLRNYIKDGKIKANRPGTDFRIPASEVERLAQTFKEEVK